MRKKMPFAVIAVLLTAVIVAVFVSPADAGRAFRAARGGLDAQLGLRFDNPLPENIKPGDTFQAMVLDPGKLGNFGFRNVKRGDKITIRVIIDDGKFEVIDRQQMSRKFLLNEQGRIGLTQ